MYYIIHQKFHIMKFTMAVRKVFFKRKYLSRKLFDKFFYRMLHRMLLAVGSKSENYENYEILEAD